MVVSSLAGRVPVTSGPAWKAPAALPTNLPDAHPASYDPERNVSQYLPRDWDYSYGQVVGRNGLRGQSGTDDLMVTIHTEVVRPGASITEGPILVQNAGTPEQTLAQALADARAIAQAADQADPTGTRSRFHSVAIVQAAFGHLALFPTEHAETNTERGTTPAPFLMTVGGANPTVVRPTDPALLGVVNATHWIDTRMPAQAQPR